MKYQILPNREGLTERLVRGLRDRGVPLTPQRRAVIETLGKRSDHPTAESIYEAVRKRLPDISRMTVYRTLDLLVEIGNVRKVGQFGSSVRYDPITARHHHLACIRCDALVDLHDPALDGLDLPAIRRTGFKVTDYSVMFTGVCPACRREATGLAPGR